MSLSTPQIAAQLERVLASDPSTVALAIRAKARQPWPETLNQRGRQFALRWCESSLAIREALCDVEQHDPATAGLVVLTPLATHEIAEDIAARLARAGVRQITTIGADTCADDERYFSNRRAFLRGEADYGRNLSAIALVA